MGQKRSIESDLTPSESQNKWVTKIACQATQMQSAETPTTPMSSTRARDGVIRTRMRERNAAASADECALECKHRAQPESQRLWYGSDETATLIAPQNESAVGMLDGMNPLCA